MALSDKPVVAAIDFGTTYSGYAFSFKHDFKSNPLRIIAPNWPSENMLSQKAPTAVLLDKNKQFHSFGYEAENKYSELIDDEEHEDWMYFKNFKMLLYENELLTRGYCIQDENGHEVSALYLFSMVIGYMKKLILKDLRNKETTLVDSDIDWVLTVPAIWDNAAKQFMREAAEMAGIDGDNLTLALEPEAASMLCKYLEVEKSNDSQVDPFSVGKKYMVLDAGGGTVDIVFHEVLGNGCIKELHCASGGNWGGITVDNEFQCLLETIVGQEVITTYRKGNTSDYIELFRNFELKKRTFSDEDETVNLVVPHSFQEWVEEKTHKTLQEKLMAHPVYSEVIYFKRSRLHFKSGQFKKLFEPSCENIVCNLKTLFRKPSVQGTDAILMVGGFSKCTILQNKIKMEFPNMKVIIPPDADIAVVKGAVLFGHCPSAISSRIARYTYGVQMYVNFQEGFHKEEKRQLVGNKWKCRDVFSKHIEKGQTLVVGEAQVAKQYLPVTDDQSSVDFNIYASTETRLLYVTDDSCRKIGSISIGIPCPSLYEDRPSVTVKMIYGGTEISVQGSSGNSKVSVFTKIDFLG